MTKKLRRCELAVPGSKWRFIEKAANIGVDAVFLDLEDAVAPAEKEAARDNIVRALNELDWDNTLRMVRINALDTHYAYRDIIHVVEGARENIDVIVVPKVNSAADVYMVETLLTQIEKANQIQKEIGIECLIETAKGMMNVEEIAFSSPRLKALIFGIADYTASIGARTTAIGGHGGEEMYDYPGDRWNYAISRMVVSAKAAGILAIDGPHGDISDSESYRQSAAQASMLGCNGKWAIHPSQIAIAEEVFSPNEEEIRKARAIIQAYEDGKKRGLGAVTLEGKMIDAASIKLAENVIKTVDAIGEKVN